MARVQTILILNVCSVFHNMRLIFVPLKLTSQGEYEPNNVASLNFEPIPRMLPSKYSNIAPSLEVTLN